MRTFNQMSKNIGRPPKPDDERADDRLFVRLLAAEKASWQAAADKEGLKLSEWIRKHLNKIAERQNRD